MRLEGDRNRLYRLLPRALHNLAKNVGVGAMHTVKVANAHQRRTEASGNVFEFVKNIHFVFRRKLAWPSALARLNLKLQFQPVIGKPDVGRQLSVGGRVRQFVGDMCKERSLWFEPLHDLQRVLYR